MRGGRGISWIGPTPYFSAAAAAAAESGSSTPMWTAPSSPGSSTVISGCGGRRSAIRRPHAGQDHSSAPEPSLPVSLI